MNSKLSSNFDGRYHLVNPILFRITAIFYLGLSVYHFYVVGSQGFGGLLVLAGVLHILSLIFLNILLSTLFGTRMDRKRGWFFLVVGTLGLGALFGLLYLKGLKPGIAGFFYLWIAFPVPNITLPSAWANLAVEVSLTLYYWHWIGEAFDRFAAHRARLKQTAAPNPKPGPLQFQISFWLSALSILAASYCYLITWWIPSNASNTPWFLLLPFTVSVILTATASGVHQRGISKGNGWSTLKPTTGWKTATYLIGTFCFGNLALFFLWPALAHQFRLPGHTDEPGLPVPIRGWACMVIFFAFIILRDAALRNLKAEGKYHLPSHPVGRISYEEAIRRLDREGRLDLRLRLDYRLKLLASYGFLRFVFADAFPIFITYQVLTDSFKWTVPITYPLAVAGILTCYHLTRFIPLLGGCLTWGPVLTVTPEGLWCMGRGLLHWSDLKAIQVAHKMREKMLKLIPRNDQFLQDVPWWASVDARLFYRQTGLYERYGMESLDMTGPDLVKILHERYGVAQAKPSVEIMRSADPATQAGDSPEDIRALVKLRNLSNGRLKPQKGSPEEGTEGLTGPLGKFLGKLFQVMIAILVFGVVFTVVFSMTGLDKVLHWDMADWLNKFAFVFFAFFFGTIGIGILSLIGKGWKERMNQEGPHWQAFAFTLLFSALSAAFLYLAFTFLKAFIRF